MKLRIDTSAVVAELVPIRQLAGRLLARLGYERRAIHFDHSA